METYHGRRGIIIQPRGMPDGTSSAGPDTGEISVLLQAPPLRILRRHPARLFDLASAHLEVAGWTSRGRSRDPMPGAARLCRCGATIPAIPVRTFRPVVAVAHWRANYRRTCICWLLLPEAPLFPFTHFRQGEPREPAAVITSSRDSRLNPVI
jgi:hypothetical protein